MNSKKRTRTDRSHERVSCMVLEDIDLLTHILWFLDDLRELCKCSLVSPLFRDVLNKSDCLWESVKVVQWKVPCQWPRILEKKADLVKNITGHLGYDPFRTYNIPDMMTSLINQFKNLSLVKLDIPISRSQIDNLKSIDELPKTFTLKAPLGMLATQLDTIHTEEQWDRLHTFLTDSHSGQQFQPEGLCLSIGRGPMAKAGLKKRVLRGLGQMLCENSAVLRLIDLRGQHLGPEGLRWLVKDLKEPWNQELDSLNLTDNGICGIRDCPSVDLEDVSGAYNTSGLEALLSALVDNGRLKSLDLSRNVLNVRIPHVEGTANLNAIQMLSKKISRKHCPLTMLRLDNTRLAGRCNRQDCEDTQALECLAKALKMNTSLTNLYVCGNFIGAKGTEALAPGLQENHTLTSLDISDNDLGIYGAKSLSEAVMPRSGRKSAIKVLTCDVKIPIERILKGEITELDIGSEGGIEAAVILCRALQHNSKLLMEADASSWEPSS